LHPILFRIPLPWGGHFYVASYGVMMALGVVAAVFVALRLARRDGIRAETVIDIAFWGVLGGIAGAKAWFIAQNWGDVADKWDLFRNFRSGLVFYGGVLGGAAGIIGYAAAARVSILKLLDVAAPASMLGLAFGRVGCFLNGCCYGSETFSAIGVCFRKVVENGMIVGSPAFVEQMNKGMVTAASEVSKPVLPSQLFEVAGALAVFALLLALRRTRRFYGEGTALLFVLYAIVRFGVEFTRGDNVPVALGLTIPQLFSAGAFVAGIAGFVYLRAARPARLALAEPEAAQGGSGAAKKRGG